MRPDKLTSKFQMALADAQSLAVGRAHQFIEPVHLMAALLDQQGSTLRGVLTKAGANVNLLRSQLGDAIDRLPRVEGAGGEVHIGNDLTKLLNITDKLAQEREDQYVSSEIFLLACLDDDLACAIPGIPATDFARLTWRHGPPLHLKYAEHHGLVHDETAELMQVVSPLVLEPQVPKERRYIFAAASDLLVPPDQVRDLWRHWDRPRIEWFQGAHLTFGFHPRVERLLADAFRESGLAA